MQTAETMAAVKQVVERVRAKSAVLFLVSDQGLLLLLRDNNPNIPFPLCWTLPGGGVEEHDKCGNEAAERELLEEFGLKNVVLHEIGITPKHRNGFYYGDVTGCHIQRGEGCAHAFFSVEAIEAMFALGNFDKPGHLGGIIRSFVMNNWAEFTALIKDRKRPDPKIFE